MGSRLSVKIKVAKAEKAITKLELDQLKKMMELQQKKDVVQREQEILEAENEVEPATLRANILEEFGVQQMVDPSHATEGKSLVEPERAYEAVYLTAATKEETMSAPLPGTSVTLSPADPVWMGVPNRSEASLTRSCNEVPSPETRFQQLLEQQQQMIQLHQETFQSVASTIRQGFAVASWLVRSSQERVVRVRALAGDTVLCSWAQLSPAKSSGSYGPLGSKGFILLYLNPNSATLMEIRLSFLISRVCFIN